MRVSPAPPRGPAHARPHPLPAPLTRLIGREAEVAAVRDALLAPEVRLLTLVGAPGIGKTRLSLAVAQALAAGPPAGAHNGTGAEPGFADGVVLVPLAPLRDPELVVAAIAHALGVREIGGRPVLDGLKAALGDRRLLLVLDNCEHVVAAAPTVAELLGTCPGLTVLATSRAPLHVYGEHEYPVSPLALPNLVRFSEPHALACVPAVALLVERARAVRPDFRLTPQNASAVAEVCVRLDGLPLALELAAARLKVLPPEAILARLGSRLDLLGDGAQDRPERHQTLRAALAWSHDLLSAGEQRLLRRLAVFAGGCTLEAAEAVCNSDGDLAVDVLDGIAALVDQSLVRAAEQPDGEPRYTMLETIREYGLECLAANGELDEIRRRHAEYYVELAEAAWPKLSGPQQRAWLRRLEGEHDNLRAALTWSQRASDPEVGLRLGWALHRFWWWCGHVSEGRRWLARALERDTPRLAPARAAALNAAAVLARVQGDYAAAHLLSRESLAIFRELGDRWGIASALSNLGSVSLFQGDYAEAAPLIDESLALWRALGDASGIANVLALLGDLAQALGDYEGAGPLLEESLALDRARGDARAAAIRLCHLADLVREQGQYGRARALLAEALALGRELGDRGRVAQSLSLLSRVAREQGDYERATAVSRESLVLFREGGEAWGITECLEALASVAGSAQRPERAARLFGAARMMREAIGFPVPPPNRDPYERDLAAVRSELAEEAFAAAWAEGQAMSLEQAVEYALTLLDPTSAPAVLVEQPAVAKPSDPLTPREREVAALVARGLTDAQLAEGLLIGRRTAEKHVANCLGKLGLATRAGLAAWAVEQGLPASRPA